MTTTIQFFPRRISQLLALLLIVSSGSCLLAADTVIPDLKGVRLRMSVSQVQTMMKTREAPFPVGSSTLALSVTTTVGGAVAKVYYSFEKPKDPSAAPTLFRIIATFSTSAASPVLDGLKQKYGSPSKFEEVTKSNRMGAKFSGFEAEWTLGKYRISLDSPGSKVDEASLHIYDYDRAARLTQQSQKARSKDL